MYDCKADEEFETKNTVLLIFHVESNLLDRMMDVESTSLLQ